MKKRYYVSTSVVSAAVLAGALWWLTARVLPNLGIAHLVPLKETHQLTQNGSAMIIFKNSNFEGYRNFESIETGWSGVGAAWPHILVGMILGAVAGYFMGLPERMFIEFAEKSLAHSNDTLSIAERKEKEAAHEMSKAEDMQCAAYVRNTETAKQRKEVELLRKDAERQMAIADDKIRQAEEKDKELTKAQAKIRRLEKRIARQTEKTIDDADKPD